jgi:hypothetical protein
VSASEDAEQTPGGRAYRIPPARQGGRTTCELRSPQSVRNAGEVVEPSAVNGDLAGQHTSVVSSDSRSLRVAELSPANYRASRIYSRARAGVHARRREIVVAGLARPMPRS